LTASLPADDLPSPEVESARKYLGGVARRLEASGIRVHARVEIAPIVAPAILEIARGEHADVVALATHGRSGFARLRLGSVADKLIRGSHTPILLFRPPLPPAPSDVAS
jgi:nucleotide-binding universal stress UspA family protein